MYILKEKINVYDMTCKSCELKIEKAIKKLNGIVNVKANYEEQWVKVEYANDLCSLNDIRNSIIAAGYCTNKKNEYNFIGIFIIAAVIFLLGLKTSGFNMEAKLQNASYAIIFLIGVLTSIHCVGMCGGIMLSQSFSSVSKNKFDSIKPALLYNLGRVVSYTLLGGIVGALGSVFSLSITAKAILQIFAAVFMLIMGLNMLGLKTFRKFNLRLPSAFYKLKAKARSSFLVGFFNGLMPCGPLQTMQLYALGTGSAAGGALSMLSFSLGTVPLMFAFGALSGILTKGYTKKLLKFSGVLIITLGLIMGNRGLTLAGLSPNNTLAAASQKLFGSASNTSSISSSNKATLSNGIQTITMNAVTSGYTPNVFYVQKNIPVKWIINGKQLTSCNNEIVIQALNIQKKLSDGQNIIEFKPGDKDINFSCWMGMIGGVIKVVDNLDSIDTSKTDTSVPSGTSPSCCTGAANSTSSSSSENSNSIYGNNIKNIPTKTIVNRSKISNDVQIISFKGIGYELKPLIVVAESSTKTELKIDFKAFDDVSGKFYIVETNSSKVVYQFNTKKSLKNISIKLKTSSDYAIVKDNVAIGLITVVKNPNNANLNKIRSKFIN